MGFVIFIIIIHVFVGIKNQEIISVYKKLELSINPLLCFVENLKQKWHSK